MDDDHDRIIEGILLICFKLLITRSLTMKKVILSIGLVLLVGGSSLAQKQKTSPDTVEDPRPKKEKSATERKNDRVFLNSASSLEAQLQNTVDVRKSRVGDEVILKVTKSVKQDGTVVIPKGSNLIGRITEVKQRSKENAVCKIGMVFDRIEGKSLSAPITASVMSITDLRAASTVSDTIGTDVSGSSRTSTSGSARSSSGGGLLGGVGSTVGGVVNSTTQTVGGVVNSTTQTVGGVTTGATQTLGNTTQTLGGTLSGIQISQSASGSAQGSTTLSSGNKNIRLEKGLTFQMRLDSAVRNQE